MANTTSGTASFGKNFSIDEIVDGNLLNKLGLSIVKFELPAIIGEIEKNSPAEASRLLKNDRIIAINSNLINSWGELVEIIKGNPGEYLNVEILRDETLINIQK